ncbi:cytochrome P450 [Catenulispora subtropica]|uniref:Cytochrome P450 n=1 Tax=Catenulispora subtropica TaxID=450798 RepID=A0ABN2TAT2_9ACTN
MYLKQTPDSWSDRYGDVALIDLGASRAARRPREEGLIRVELPGLGQGWQCSDYADVRQILTDARFDVKPPDCVPSAKDSAEPSGGRLSTARLTNVAMAGMKPRRIERLRPETERTASELLVRLAGTPQPADLMAGFVKPLASSLLCELLQIPDGGREPMRAMLLSAATTGNPLPDAAKRDQKALTRCLAALLTARAAGTGDDLLSAMVRVRGEGEDRLDDGQLVSVAFRLLIPGLQNMVLMTANVLRTLLRHPQDLDRLASRPESVPSAVEELIRVTPLASTASFPRYAVRDAQIAGTPVRRGDLVVGSLAAANHDPRVFADPRRFDIERGENAHLTFGMGAHYCPGAGLARMQIQVAVEVLARQPGGVREAVPGGLGEAATVGWDDTLSVRWPVG